jgi:hypothetical protein
MARIHVIQPLGNFIALLSLQELRNRRGVQLTSRNVKAACSDFRQPKKVIA